MNEEKSAIDSFSVSMGPSSKAAPIPRAQQGEPWNILVFSDLRFKTASPLRITIAEWNDIMKSGNIVLAGAVKGVPDEKSAPLYIEHGVSSMKDFSAESLKNNAAFIGFSRVLETLTRLMEGTTSMDEARRSIESASLPPEERATVRSLLDMSAPAAGSSPRPTQAGSPLDKILSMVDMGAASPPPPDQPLPHTATESLFASITGNSAGITDKSGIEAYIQKGNTLLRQRLAAVQSQPFFSSVNASWQCLRYCAKIIGRSKEIRLHVFSAPREEAQETFAKVLTECVDTAGVPDIILWDYGVSFTNAHMEGAAALAEAADKYKCMLLAPLSLDDPLFTELKDRDTIAPLFREPRFLPLKKLRANVAARCLCLCGPDMILQDSQPAVAARGCWPIAIRWLEMLVSGANPFAIAVPGAFIESLLETNADFDRKVSPYIRKEAADHGGLTLFDAAPMSSTLDRIMTAIDPSIAGDAYGSCAFNFLVNRIARLSALRLMGRQPSAARETLAADLREFLYNELAAYRVCTSQEQVSVRAKEMEVEIEINSDIIVGGVPARFSFSLEY
jgi:predicted component of type VI protein secretion system